MATATRDENSVPVLLGTLNTNGSTPIAVKVNATTHAISASDGITGSDNGPTNAPHDENDVPALIATSNVDGITPVIVYANSSGQLLLQST